jgi:transcriptional antiterminator NusG
VVNRAVAWFNIVSRVKAMLPDEPTNVEADPTEAVNPELDVPEAATEVEPDSVVEETAAETETPAPDEEPEAEVEATEEEETAPEETEEEPAETVAPVSAKQWYVVKVQSGREESIKEAIERRVRIEGLQEYVGRIVIPIEKVTEMRKGKKYTRKRKLYPGYLMCEVEFNDDVLYLFRETSGVGDFVGGSVNRPPAPMPAKEVEAMLQKMEEVETGKEGGGRVIKAKPKFDRGDHVRVKDGTFAGMEGEVKELIEDKGLVKIELTIFGRPVPVELEYWQVEPV